MYAEFVDAIVSTGGQMPTQRNRRLAIQNKLLSVVRADGDEYIESIALNL